MLINAILAHFADSSFVWRTWISTIMSRVISLAGGLWCAMWYSKWTLIDRLDYSTCHRQWKRKARANSPPANIYRLQKEQLHYSLSDKLLWKQMCGNCRLQYPTCQNKAGWGNGNLGRKVWGQSNEILWWPIKAKDILQVRTVEGAICIIPDRSASNVNHILFHWIVSRIVFPTVH